MVQSKGIVGLGAVEDAACLDLEVLDLRLGFEQRAFGGHPGDPHEHVASFAFYSLFVKRRKRLRPGLRSRFYGFDSDSL